MAGAWLGPLLSPKTSRVIRTGPPKVGHQDKPPPAWSSARQANRHKTDEQRGYPDHLRKSRKARGSVTAPTVYGRFRLNRIGVSLASLSSVPVRPGTAVPGGSRVHFSGAVESHLPASGPTLECR